MEKSGAKFYHAPKPSSKSELKPAENLNSKIHPRMLSEITATYGPKTYIWSKNILKGILLGIFIQNPMEDKV
jgi:hypothetical protein